jgi:hypothetical protein
MISTEETVIEKMLRSQAEKEAGVENTALSGFMKLMMIEMAKAKLKDSGDTDLKAAAERISKIQEDLNGTSD